VLKAPDVPSVLVELGYLSNREDGRLLRNSNHVSKLMRAVVTAISLYFDGEKC
jgi:N-acetylmuramoyl-L-alanine amidase